MKKSLLVIFALFICAFGAVAQITITTADIAAPTKIIYQSNDTLPSGSLSVGSAGISQTWNMSMLNASTTDTMTFISYAWAPNPLFSSSNLVMKQGWQNNFSYLTNSASGLTADGVSANVDLGAGPMNLTIKNSPSEKLMNFPANYLTNFTSNYKSITPAFYFGVDPGIGLVIDSVRMTSGVRKTVTVDAWGTLTTPLGTFNVLRSKETIVKYDTTDVSISGFWNPLPGFTPLLAADSTTGYTWWANGVGFPLVSIKLDSLSAVKEVTWLQSLPLVGINEATAASQVNVFPNPAQNEITFAVEASKVSSIQLFDIAGRMIDSYTVSGNTASINTSDFANGVYSYTLIGNDNAILNRGKFTVAK